MWKKSLERLSQWSTERAVHQELKRYLRDHGVNVPLSDTDWRAVREASEPSRFQRALGRMNMHVGQQIRDYVQRYPEYSINDICNLVFNHHSQAVATGMGNLLPTDIRLEARTAVGNALVAHLVARYKIEALHKD